MIVILIKCLIFAVEIKGARGVAQLAARHVRDVEVGSSSLLTPTKHDTPPSQKLWRGVILIYHTFRQLKTLINC